MSIAMKLNQVFTSVAGKPKTATVETKQATSTQQPNAKSSLTSTTLKHKSGKFFEDIEAKLKQEGAAMVSKVQAIIGFQVNCAGNQTISYVVDLKNGSGSVFVNDGCILFTA